MQDAPPFLAGCVLPVLAVLAIAVVSYVVWRRSQSTRNLEVERATAPFIAGVSVLAIAIPLVANLLFELTRAGATGLAPGLLLGGLALAVMSLVAGGYLIYKLSLETTGKNLKLQGGPASHTLWISTAMSFQLLSMVGFLVISFFGLLVYSYSLTRSSPKSATLLSRAPEVTVLKGLPQIGYSRDDVTQTWGSPASEGDDWLVYVGPNNAYLFCFREDHLSQITEYERSVQNAIGPRCFDNP